MTGEELWSRYCSQSGVSADSYHSAWAFGGAPDKLAVLVKDGKKKATASGYDIYLLDDSEKMPEVGDYSIVLDSYDNAVCVIKTTKLYVSEFDDVTAEHAAKEGEGDLSLEYWRRVHEEFFMGECEAYGIKFDGHFRVLCEEFECVYTE